MNVKGILIEGRDGREYLLGFGRQPTGQMTGPPTLSRRGPDGAFQLFGKELFLWTTFADVLRSLPTLPTWPTWSPPQ